MPPFRRIKPRVPAHTRTPFVVNVPECEWCGVAGAHKCKGCERWSCWKCTVEFEHGKCTHLTYNPVQSVGWGNECPNLACDSECNVCMGRGIVFMRQLSRSRRT